MNRRQKLVQQQFLNNEQNLVSRLEQIYGTALTDITDKISDLDKSIGDLQKVYAGIGDQGGLNGIAFEYFNKRGANQAKYYAHHPEEARELLRSAIQSKVYQKNYQQVLQDQVGGILNQMQTKQFLTISDYLDTCYEDGFIGSVFDMHGQNVPLMMPINQEAMVRAVQLDSPIKEGLYTHLGENVDVLKKNITAQVSRGIATGMSYGQVARQVSNRMVGAYKNPGGSMAYAMRIARTEGHRIQCTAAMDAAYQAKERGADVLKQWDAALDDKTRESHVMVDGEIRELDKPFSNGLMFPGDPKGGAAEVVNCRCALLQRARWALDEDELKTLQDRAAFFGLDKSEQFNDFKQNYLKAVAEPAPVVSAFDSAMVGATSPVELWMNMTDEQQAIFKASGMKIDELFEQLNKTPTQILEWKPANPGGVEKYALPVDFTGKSVVFERVHARSDGWMADANIPGVIRVREDGLGDDWEFIITHECGHQLSNMYPELQQIIMDNPGNILGRYNLRVMKFDGVYYEYNPDEAFATCVSNYYRNPERMKEMYPEAYDAIDVLFKTSSGARTFIENALNKYRSEFL